VADDNQEIPTNDEWRDIMVRARKDKELTQAQLAARVGTSQNMISLIESGEVESSQFVWPICKTLDIPPRSCSRTRTRRRGLSSGTYCATRT
jgi:transcriptional regulator with XRE-family HTH domain